MGGFVSTAAQVAAGALLPSLAALRAHHNAALDNDAPGSRRPSPAGAAAPSYTDVLDVLEILQQLHLPVELAIEILDAAFVAPFSPPLLGNWAPEKTTLPSMCTGNTILPSLLNGPATKSRPPDRAATSREPPSWSPPHYPTSTPPPPPLPNIYAAPEHYVKRVSVWTDSRDQGEAPSLLSASPRERDDAERMRDVPEQASPRLSSFAEPERAPPHGSTSCSYGRTPTARSQPAAKAQRRLHRRVRIHNKRRSNPSLPSACTATSMRLTSSRSTSQLYRDHPGPHPHQTTTAAKPIPTTETTTRTTAQPFSPNSGRGIASLSSRARSIPCGSTRSAVAPSRSR